MIAETMDGGLLRKAAEIKNDEKILVQIRGKDCVAVEVRYHKVCYSNYTRFLTKRLVQETERCTPQYEKSFDIFCEKVIDTEVINERQIKYMKDLLQKFIFIAQKTENVDASKYRAFKLKQRLIKRYPQLVFCTPTKRNVSEIVYVENLDSSELVEEHMLHKNDEDCNEVDSSDDEDYVEDDNSRSTPEVNELHLLYNAALILRKKIKEIPQLNLPWPPLASDLTQDNIKKVVPCELFNVLSWVCGFSSEATLSEYVPIDSKKSAKLSSIIQDIVNLSTGGRNPTPKSIALAMAIRQMTGSASVITLISGLGHCMSHSFVLSHETALAQLNMSNDSAIPPGFMANVPTTLAWDNDDFSEETRSGKGTTHITGGIIIQREKVSTAINDLKRREDIPRLRKFTAPSRDIDNYSIGKRKTVDLNVAMANTEIGVEYHVSPQIDAKKKDLAFTLCRFLGNSISLPNWTGFNTKLTISRNIPKQSKIGYLPVIDASPTEFSTVKEILVRSEEIANKLKLKYICLVFDEAIYAKVQQVRWKDESYLGRFVVRLGDFHMAMSFCGAISNLFKDAGLKVSLLL